MTEQRVLHIRKSIAVAQKLERENHSLENYLCSKSKEMHHSINLQSQKGQHALYSFVNRYIELVPELLDAVKFISIKTGINDITSAFIRIAEDYFISSPLDVEHHNGLLELVNEAYFTHRLIEELNDRIHTEYGAPIIPIDMTISNLVVHDILGDEVANTLDAAIFYLIEAMFCNDENLESKKSEYEISHKNIDWEQALDTWPCLKDPCPVTLELNEQFSDVIH